MLPVMLQLHTRILTVLMLSLQGSTVLGVSVQASCCWLLFRMDRHTALLHLKPLPKAICQILSPFRIPLVDSMLDRTYLQVDVQPHKQANKPAAQDESLIQEHTNKVGKWYPELP